MLRRNFLKSVLAAGTATALAALRGPVLLAANADASIPFVVVRRVLLHDAGHEARDRRIRKMTDQIDALAVRLCAGETTVDGVEIRAARSWWKQKRLSEMYGASFPSPAVVLQRLDTDEYGIVLSSGLKSLVSIVHDAILVDALTDMPVPFRAGIDPTTVASWHATQEDAITAAGGLTLSAQIKVQP